MSLCIEIGAAARAARRSGQTPLDAILELLPKTHYRHARCLFEGKIVDLDRRTERGFAVGRIRIDTFDQGESPLEITFQNENLIARQENRVLAIVPDLICILDHETAEPITTEWLRYGQRVSVVGVAVPEIMRRPECLKLFGPQAFGIDDPFVPIERLGS